MPLQQERRDERNASYGNGMPLQQERRDERNSSDRDEMPLPQERRDDRKNSDMRSPPVRSGGGIRNNRPQTKARERKGRADEGKNVGVTRIAREKKVVKKRNSSGRVSAVEDSESGSESSRSRKRRKRACKWMEKSDTS
jgi:hypothetical protein